MAVISNMGSVRLWLNAICSVILVLLCFIQYGLSFNVDTVNFIKHSGDPGSMFGFSVAEHKEHGRSWVLVGAPEAQTAQMGVDRGGAVYKCDVTADNACEQIGFDRSGNKNNSEGVQIDKKSYQWFGATVRSSGENGVVLACAPRYVWFSTTTAYRRDPVGTCYITTNHFQNFMEFSPCRTRNWGYHRQGSCQAGLGADVSKDGQRLYIGAPGSWYWQGQVYDIASSFKMPTISPDYSKTNDLNLIAYESGNKDGRNKSRTLGNTNNQQYGGGQLYAQNPHKSPEVWATREGSPQDDDSYLGYSVASGNFEGSGSGGVAVGMPRGANLLGKVVLYTTNLTNLQNITGHQLGSYFSYSVAAIDLDGDSLDDLIIGAPLYSDLSNNEGKYETGRVYIYFNAPVYDHEGYFMRFVKWTYRDGTNSKSRFGLSVAALGDINKDGFGDFAVGAPYDGESGRGAVYVYHGMRKGIRESYSQVIKGEELSVPVSTFGFAISGGLDMDGNQYPDMVVGAYESDTAIFFRSRPVVKVVESRVSFQPRNKQISLDDKPCTLRDHTQVSCTNLEACLRYAGDEVSDVLDFDIGITLDSKKAKSPRMYFLNDEGKHIKNDTIRLTKGQVNCKSYYIYIKPNIRDKLTQLEAELRYNVVTRSQSGSGRRYTRSLEPALDTTELNIRKDSISIQKNCGPDNVCIPDLRLTTKKSVSKYLLGSGDKFFLDVMVENRGEDAFEAMYNLEVPQGMNFVNIERIDNDRSIPVQCSAPSAFTNNTLKCDIGNPLPKGKLVNFKVLLQPFHQEGMKPSYSFVSTVNSTNPEDDFTSTDNLQRFTVPIWVETDLILSGSSHPSEVHYNMSHYEGNITHETDIGPQVVHMYSIRNKGPANIIEAQAIFLWPSYTLAGDHLLYLLEQPETSGNIKCEFVENVNEEGILLDRKRKSYLESGQVAYSSRRVGGNMNYGVSDGKKSSRRGKGKMTEEERRRLEEEMLRKIGDKVYESGDASMIHSSRVHYQTSEDRGHDGTVSRTGQGRVASGSRGGQHASGSWGRHGSGTYEGSYRGGSTAGGSQYHWAEEGIQGRRVSGDGFRSEYGISGQDGYYIDTRNRDRNDDTPWGTPADNTDAMRRAYGSNEFRTVALDLNSDIPVINIGEGSQTVSETMGRGSSRTHYGGSTSEDGRLLGSHTYSVHVAGSGDRDQGSVLGGYGNETRRVQGGGSRTFTTTGGSSTAFGKDSSQEVGSVVTGTHSVHVSEGGTSVTSSRGGVVGTHSVHVPQGGISGTQSSDHERRTHESSGATRTEGGTVRTHTVHVSQDGITGVYDLEDSYSKEYPGREEEGFSTTAATSRTRPTSGTHTVHVSEGGSSRTYEIHGGSTRHYDHGGDYDREYEKRRQEEAARAAGGSTGTRTETVHASQDSHSRTYEVHGGSSRPYDRGENDGDYERRRQEEEARAAGGSTRTETVHISQGSHSRTYEGHGGSSRPHGEDEFERRRQEAEVALREYERRRQEAKAVGSRGGNEQGIHMTQGGTSRTFVTQGGSSGTYSGGTYDEEYERRRLESEAAGRQSGTGDTSYHGSTEYSYHLNTSLGADSGRRNGTTLFDWNTGSSAYGSEEERRLVEDFERRLREQSERQLQESVRRSGGRIVEGGSSRWVVFDNGTVVPVSAMQNPEYEERMREEYQRRLRIQLERERERQREERLRNVGRTSSHDQDEERRRMEQEAAERARESGSGSTHHYSTQYSYHVNTSYESGHDGDSSRNIHGKGGGVYYKRVKEDLEKRLRGKSLQELENLLRGTNGRIVEGGSSRWVVFPNGTIISVGATDNPEFEKRLHEEFEKRWKYQLERERDESLRNSGSSGSEGRTSYWYSYSNVSSEYAHDPDYQKRLQEDMERRLREDALRKGGSQEHYYNRSYSSESRYTRHDRGYDPDLGYEAVGKDDLTGSKSDVRHRRMRQRVSSNSLDDESSSREATKSERSKREHIIPRFKRFIEEGVDLKSSLKCGPTDCTKIMCTVGPLTRGQEAWVAFRGRVWVRTLKEIGQDRVIRLSSLQASQLTKLPHIGEPESAKVEAQEVFTEIMPQDVPLKPEVAPLWIWVLSACAGTLILLLLIFLLWKLGFFKRNRPSNAPEKQPLNRNGYQAGDEAL